EAHSTQACHILGSAQLPATKGHRDKDTQMAREQGRGPTQQHPTGGRVPSSSSYADPSLPPSMVTRLHTLDTTASMDTESANLPQAILAPRLVSHEETPVTAFDE